MQPHFVTNESSARRVAASDAAAIGGTPDSAYQVRLARAGELEAVFRLRYDVFYTEMGADDSVSAAAGLDVDRFDELCDHLVVTAAGAIVGTYRLLPRRRILGLGLDLYSEGEFDISPIKDLYGADVLELGRSCVHPNYRTGPIPKLLWAGIARYMLVHDIKALTGCVSVHGVSDVQALRLRQTLKERDHWHDAFDCAVRAGYAVAPEAVAAFEESNTMVPNDPFALIPPLMKGYFNLGATICGGPAHDAPFHCHDFLVLLDAARIKPKYFRALVQPLLDRGMIGALG